MTADIDVEAESQKAHDAVGRFLDREEKRLAPVVLTFALIEQGIRRLLAVVGSVEIVGEMVEETLAEAAKDHPGEECG